ncbi:hypothetical protein T265_01633 [Opisthorchis viverrini]|uniref:Uncharacterized protein n=1 Tax=Opisthorchis viverrini TaxID=6198 RepID=A0A074ZXP3_OPIVI|nr:hypothetical protein T265_01633 [Opisthorchis viverrini]KER32198.1 hypothetical protein T265_01633 [Opisthorchis viverrini]
MSSFVDYSYRYPIDRTPKFNLLPNEQIKQASSVKITRLSGAYQPYTTDIRFGAGELVQGQKVPNTGELLQRIPLERDLHKIQPSLDKSLNFKKCSPVDSLSISDFHRFRRLKDYEQKLVSRVPDILAYKYCASCSASHLGGCIGCRRDDRYYQHGPTRKMPFRNQRPDLPFGRGHYGYQHEQLDRHNTGHFWLSKYH